MNKIIVKSVLAFLGCAVVIVSLAFNYEPPPSQAAASGGFETRCGWFDNPTPNNASLFDKDAEWVISTQGGYFVEEDWKFPIFKPKQWVHTNAASYGYGCACLQMKIDHKAEQVRQIKSARAQPLSKCRRDKSLKQWKDQFK